MKILVFDTCFNKSYIVLREDSTIIESKIISSTADNYHSAFLIPEIRNILIKNKLLIKDLDAIGVNIGPGSFTGIRAGITIARVFAQQANIKLIGVESLKILSHINKTNKETVVLTDARKNKVYLAKYNSAGTEVISPCLTEKERICDFLNNNEIIITDNSIGSYLNEKGIKTLLYEENDTEFGLYLSEEVYNRLKNNAEENYHWAKVKPLYIQPPSITKSKSGL